MYIHADTIHDRRDSSINTRKRIKAAGKNKTVEGPRR